MATLAILLPRRLAIRSYWALSGPPPVGVCCAASQQRPAQDRGALAGDVPEAGFAVGAADGRGQPGPLAQVLGGREPFDLADLGDDQHRGVGADPADLAQQLDALVGFGALVDLAGGRG